MTDVTSCKWHHSLVFFVSGSFGRIGLPTNCPHCLCYWAGKMLSKDKKMERQYKRLPLCDWQHGHGKSKARLPTHNAFFNLLLCWLAPYRLWSWAAVHLGTVLTVVKTAIVSSFQWQSNSGISFQITQPLMTSSLTVQWTGLTAFILRLYRKVTKTPCHWNLFHFLLSTLL